MRYALLLLCAATLAAEQAPWTELAQASRQAASDPAAARAALEALVLAHPDFAAARFNLGTLLLSSDAEKAGEHLTAATRAPGVALAADAWHNLALARWHQGRLEDALAAADQAVQLRAEEPAFIITRDELRRAWLAQQDALRLKKEAEARRLRLPAVTLPDAHEGEAWSATILAQGGTPPYQFTGADLPAGLSLSAEGVLQGIPGPKTRGDHRLKITVTDAAEGSANSTQGNITLTILPPPAITTVALPEALVDVPYAAQLTAEGLRQPQWTISGLPPGIEADAHGHLHGTATAAGTYALAIRAADATHTAESTVNLVVVDSFAPREARLPAATAWAPYTHQLGVQGPAQKYTWQQSAAADGIVIQADGVVDGAPDQAGDLPLPVQLSAADGRSRSLTLILPVNPPPVIAEKETLSLQQGKLLNQALKVEGGTPPYTWSGSGGPEGIRVDADGYLRGAATVTGSSTLLVSVSDRWQAHSQLSITVEVNEAQESQDQDQDKQDQADNKEEEEKEQEEDQQQQDQAKQDQQGKPDQDQQGQEDQQADPDQGQPSKEDQAKQGQEDKQEQAEQGQEKQEQDQQEQSAADQEEANSPADQAAAPSADTPGLNMSREAADRWLEQLPPEDRNVLRLQLLYDRTTPVDPGANPW